MTTDWEPDVFWYPPHGGWPVLDDAEKKSSDMITRLDAWIKKHPTLDGMVVGGAAGSAVGPLGTVAGAIVGANIGHMAGEDSK